MVDAQPVTDQTADPAVGVSACLHTLITPSAFVEIQHQQALRFHQALGQERIHGHSLYLGEALAVFRGTPSGDRLQAAPHFRKMVQHQFEIFHANAHDFYVIERNAIGGAHPSAQQRKFAEEP